MSGWMTTWPARYLVALVLFLVLDGLWLGLVANAWYADQLGPLQADQPNFLAAGVFYLFFLVGLLWFVVRPALERNSLRHALGSGAFFGAITYATWDLTNLAVLADFPAAIVPVDIAWGALLCASVAGGTFWLTRDRASGHSSDAGQAP